MKAAIPVAPKRPIITPREVKKARLDSLMARHELTSDDVAKLFDVHPVTVRRWRTKGTISIKDLEYLEYRYPK